MANVTSGWRIPQLAFERSSPRERDRERERGMQQLIEVTSNTWPSTAPTAPALPCAALLQQRLISHQLIINERRCA